MRPDKEYASELLREYNRNEALIKHGTAVSGVMKHFAELYGEDEEKWEVIGLLHDLDYEMYPDKHCTMSAEIMREKGIDEDYVRAVMSHGYGMCSDVMPEHFMEKVLYTVDELTGLINAAALMRPSGSVMDLEYKSVIKKFKQQSFAAGVDRDIIMKGCSEMLNMELQYIIEQTILGMRKVAAEIGLG